jgi:hypothetical protein
MSKKKERVTKLIALDTMIRHQKRSKAGNATFDKGQLDAALQVIGEVLKLDHITCGDQP